MLEFIGSNGGKREQKESDFEEWEKEREERVKYLKVKKAESLELKPNQNLYLYFPILLTSSSLITLFLFLHRSLPASQKQTLLSTHNTTPDTNLFHSKLFIVIIVCSQTSHPFSYDQSSQLHFQHVGIQLRVQWCGEADRRV